MATVDVDGSSLPADSKTKLVRGLVAYWHSVCIHQVNQSTLAMACHDDSTINIILVIIIRPHCSGTQTQLVVTEGIMY